MFKRGLIEKRTRNFLVSRHPRVVRFYLLPKIHKPGNPRRPIVSSNSAPTENILSFFDSFLQPIVTKLPSCIRNTTDFINRLQGLLPLPPECLLVTLNVSSLYTNIPHQEGIIACEEFLDLRESPVSHTADLCQLIRYILSTNAFTFKENYLQVHGTPKGTHMTPPYVNLFMGKLEREFLQTQNEELQVWQRNIDNTFAIWTYGGPFLRTFLESLSHYHTTIKFTAEWSAI